MPKTKRVRIAVAIDDTGAWAAQGQSIEDREPYPDDEMAAWVLDGSLCMNASKMVHFVEADIPIPESATVQGTTDGDRAAKALALEIALKRHDWYYSYSDDHGVYQRGAAQLAEINRLLDAVDGDTARKLWSEHAPKECKFPGRKVSGGSR